MTPGGAAWRAAARAALAACALLTAAATSSGEETPALTEYDVKAAYLYNFAKFVEWPPPDEESARRRFVIAVLGDDPFGRTLEETLAGKTVGDRSFAVRRVSTPEQAEGAQIVFVSASEWARLPHVLRVLDGAGALTVGDMRQFAERGGMIGFRMEGRKVRFDINPEPVERAGLRMSSQLLRLARIVTADERR